MHPLAARALSLVVPPFCWQCGADARHGEPLCRACRGDLRWLEPAPVHLGGSGSGPGVELFAPVAYDGPARALVRALKYRGAAGLADPMAAQMAARAPAGFLDRDAVLVPVPLHRARLRRRGFNQAERIAAALARRTGLSLVDCLARGGPSSRQVGRGRHERLAQIDGHVRMRAGAHAPREAILVDDVATTGATLAACARALGEGGSHGIRALTYARTQGR